MNDETETLAEVVQLRPQESAEVVDGEIVSDAEWRELTQRQQAVERYRTYWAGSVATVRGVRTVATHQHTRTAVRHVVYVGAGAGIVAKRVWDGRTVARYERMMRSAELQGNHESALEWEERASRFRRERHQRRMDLLSAPQQVAKGAGVSVAVAGGGLLALGLVLAGAERSAHEVAVPFEVVFDIVRWLVIIVSVVWGPILLSAPWVAVATCWAIGRKRVELPAWIAPIAAVDHTGDPITPSVVVVALRDLGISSLTKAIKAMPDNGAGMVGMIQTAGCGVELDVYLPSGVDTAQIQARRRRLAENLGRHEHELYISIPPRARTVRLWVADSGALDEPIGPSPLVLDESLVASYRAGRAPWGQNLRGDAVALKLYQCMVLVTGLSNQGKTAAIRALALWLALDPTVEFRIGDLKGVGDWNMFLGLATVLIQGPTDEHVIAVTEMVEGGVAEMQRRIPLMQELTAQGWSQEKILADPRFHPLVLVVDEAQVAYGSSAVDESKQPYGGSKNTSRYFQAIKAIHDQGRAVNVTTWEGTQDPTNDNLPKRSREGNHIRASLVLGTESQAQMALGEAAVAAGAAPHGLRQGIDKGTLVATGEGVPLPSGQSSLVIRTHYVDGPAANEIADRAKRRRRGSIETRTAGELPAPRDLLADLDQVLGAERVRLSDLPALLRELAPTWAPYDKATGTQLRQQLTDLDVRVVNPGNVPILDPADLRRAIAERSTQDLDDEGE